MSSYHLHTHIMLQLMDERSRHNQDTEAQINIACSGVLDSYGAKIDTLVYIAQQYAHPGTLCPPCPEVTTMHTKTSPPSSGRPLLQLQKAMHSDCAQALSLASQLDLPVTMLATS